MVASYPNLIHPVPVTIEQISYSDTIYDEDTREPIQQASRTAPVTLPGQAKYGSSKEASYQEGGLRENERGYVLFRQIDLTNLSITLKINDRITRIGVVDHDAYISRVEPMGHYPNYSGNTLVKVYFADRQPSKHRT